jgi:hypothetical protein
MGRVEDPQMKFSTLDVRSAPGTVRYGLLVGCLFLVACSSQPKTDEKPSEQPVKPDAPPVISKRVSLEINGFNYTDLYIDSFEVNGQGGGNLFVSSPTSGGGGSVCCVSFSPGTTLPVRLTIKWSRDRKRWCEKEVLLTGPVPANPRHLGVHFFPDGHLEAEITEDYPEPKLRLARAYPEERKESGNTVPDEQTARCKDGYQ